jgi:hypothetical protein
MTHHPIVVQTLYYCIVAIVPTPQPRKPQTCNITIDTEVDYWRRSASKSRREGIRNTVIREMMEVEKTILDRTEHEQLQ